MMNELVLNEAVLNEPVFNKPVFNELTETVFNELTSYGCLFVKTIGKKNPRKGILEQNITNSLDEINKHFKRNSSHTIKVKLAGNIHVLDIDAHEGSTLNKEQIEMLESSFAESGFFTDRSPNGIHLFFFSDEPIGKIKMSRVCSLGFGCEVFPPNSLINLYKPTLRSVIPTLGDTLFIDFLGKNTTPMKPLTPGSRHDDIKGDLVRFRPHPATHHLFNQLWCTPPLDSEEFALLALWSESLPEIHSFSKETEADESLGMKSLVKECKEALNSKFLYYPSKKQWLVRVDPLRPVYEIIPEEFLKKSIFDHFESKGRFLRANKIKQLVEQLVLVLQVDEFIQKEQILCFTNGVFFSKDREFVPFSDPRLTNVVLSNIIPFEYNIGQRREIPENWEHFLKPLLKWETVKAEDILAVIVAHIMGLVKQQAIYYLGGPPRSGKSLAMRLVTDLFKNDVASFTVSSMNANPRFFFSLVDQKSVICFPDARIEHMTTASRDELKRLMGDDPLTVETKGLTITKRISGNFPVLISSQSELTWVQDPGISRRLVYLDFNQSIPKDSVNPNLYSELSSDMGWLIDMAMLITQDRANQILLDISLESQEKCPPTQILSILHVLHLEY